MGDIYDDAVDDGDDPTLTTGATQYAQAWKPMLLDPAIPHGAVRLYLLLCTYARAGKATVYPRQDTLAEMLDCSTDTIGRWMRVLHVTKWIDIKQQGFGKPNLVHVCVPGGTHAPWRDNTRYRTDAGSGNRTDAETESREDAVLETAPVRVPSMSEVDEVEVVGEPLSQSPLGNDEPEVVELTTNSFTDELTAPSGAASEQPLRSVPTIGTGLPKGSLKERTAQMESRGSREPNRLVDPQLAAERRRAEAERARTPEAAPAPVEGDSRGFKIRKPESLKKCLASHGIQIINQSDRRNLDKLSEIAPTLSELDGAINAMTTAEGHADLGRLINKWSAYVGEAARPAAWSTWSTKQKDAYNAHIAAGGDRYAFREGAVNRDA